MYNGPVVLSLEKGLQDVPQPSCQLNSDWRSELNKKERKKERKTLTKKNHIASFFFSLCGAVLLTILPWEMGENLKSQRGVRKTRVFVKDEKKGDGGSLCEVWVRRKTECRGQQIQSKDRLVCLWAVHSQPTLSCVFIALFWWLLWRENERTV